jgi:hypothetical protein
MIVKNFTLDKLRIVGNHADPLFSPIGSSQNAQPIFFLLPCEFLLFFSLWSIIFM